jgi:hypothetical protein
MKSFAFAVVLLAACTPDVDHYPVQPTSSPPTIGQTGQPPPQDPRPDAGNSDGLDDAGLADAGVGDDGGFGFDAMPTAFDAGAPTDVGSPAADAPP